MEVKKGLNTVQRKMLDEIYTEQFKKREQVILNEREAGLKKLQEKCLKEFSKDKEVKKLLEAGKAYFQQLNKLKSRMTANGVEISRTIDKEPELSVKTRYYGYERQEFSEVTEYENETTKIKLNLGEKKKEMRARIYGLSATYEEVNEEIKNLLKDI